jgi:hypothetical protein
MADALAPFTFYSVPTTHRDDSRMATLLGIDPGLRFTG